LYWYFVKDQKKGIICTCWGTSPAKLTQPL